MAYAHHITNAPPPRFLDLPTALLGIVAMSLCRILDIAPPDFGRYINPIQWG